MLLCPLHTFPGNGIGQMDFIIQEGGGGENTHPFLFVISEVTRKPAYLAALTDPYGIARSPICISC